jgi:hypothetical protein
VTSLWLLVYFLHRNNGVTIWDVRDLVKHTNGCATEIKLCGVSDWVPARPLGWTSVSERLRAMWLVWTGCADVVTWPGQP